MTLEQRLETVQEWITWVLEGRGCQVEGTACVQACLRNGQWSNVLKVRNISMRMSRDEVRELAGDWGADAEAPHGPLQRLGLLFWEKWGTTWGFWAKKQRDLIFHFKGGPLTTGWRLRWWKVGKNRSKETIWDGDLVQKLRSRALDNKDPDSDSGVVKPTGNSPCGLSTWLTVFMAECLGLGEASQEQVIQDAWGRSYQSSQICARHRISTMSLCYILLVNTITSQPTF